MPSAQRPKYFTPNEVSIHNTLKDLWVSFLGKVYDLSPLCETEAGKMIWRLLPKFVNFLEQLGRNYVYIFTKIWAWNFIFYIFFLCNIFKYLKHTILLYRFLQTCKLRFKWNLYFCNDCQYINLTFWKSENHIFFLEIFSLSSNVTFLIFPCWSNTCHSPPPI